MPLDGVNSSPLMQQAVYRPPVSTEPAVISDGPMTGGVSSDSNQAVTPNIGAPPEPFDENNIQIPGDGAPGYIQIDYSTSGTTNSGVRGRPAPPPPPPPPPVRST